VKPLFERIAVIGLGLLGGSVAAAAHRCGVATRVAGASRSGDARDLALARKWVDEAGSAAEAASGADLIVLATPVFAMADVLRELAPALRLDAIVTDVGSVKALLAETLPGLLPAGVCYVGSHPMAGSHERGIEYARADLFAIRARRSLRRLDLRRRRYRAARSGAARVRFLAGTRCARCDA